MSATVLGRPGNTAGRDAASSTHKRTKLETLEGNDKARGVECDKVKVQMFSTSPPVDNKMKLYLMPPLEKPEDERRRRNAVTAWRNRVLKKRQNEELQAKVDTLKETNRRLSGVSQRMEQDLIAHREQLMFDHNMKTELELGKRSLEALIQDQQGKLAFIRDHLVLINQCSDENNPARRFLTAVLNGMTSSSPPTLASPSPIATSPPRDALSPHDQQHVTSPPQQVTMPPLAPIHKQESLADS